VKEIHLSSIYLEWSSPTTRTLTSTGEDAEAAADFYLTGD
jgi:hypothetical protein